MTSEVATATNLIIILQMLKTPTYTNYLVFGETYENSEPNLVYVIL